MCLNQKKSPVTTQQIITKQIAPLFKTVAEKYVSNETFKHFLSTDVNPSICEVYAHVIVTVMQWNI